MSASDNVDVMQKKKDETPVIWREYDALRSHLTRAFTDQTEALDMEVQNVQLKLEDTDKTVNTIQTQVTELQASMLT